MDGELSHSEDGRERRAGERGTSRNGLLLVKGEAESLAVEEALNALLNGRDTSGSTNDLDRVDLLGGEAGLGERLLERWHTDSAEQAFSELLKLFSLERRRGVNIVHQRLDIDRSLGVGRQDLLESLGTGRETEDSLGRRHDVDLVLCVELLGKVLDERQSKSRPPKLRS